MADTILRLPAVKARTGLGRSSIYSYIERGDFPKPVRLGERAVGWVESQIDGWVEGRIQASKAARSTQGKRAGAT